MALFYFRPQRVRYLEAENARLWRAVDVAAMEAASEARLAFRYVGRHARPVLASYGGMSCSGHA